MSSPGPDHVVQAPTLPTSVTELVVCSLEDWDAVWRRNQFLVDALLRRSPELRVLFVEPPLDPLFELTCRRRPGAWGLRSLRADGRLRAFKPVKPLPRRFGSISDRWLLGSVLRAVRRLGFADPTLWLNDVTYAPLIGATGWSTVYDVTDDWLLAPLSPREIERVRRLDAMALALAQEVVVCSDALSASRGAVRAVNVVRNGVDVEHYSRSVQRPADLPLTPTAVYVGTLHESRLDADLLGELARAMPTVSFVLVGPDALMDSTRRALLVNPNLVMLGAKPYEDVPSYLQHADVVIVPHRVTAFTESLDPIKAYECLAVGAPTVATPVAGFRQLGDPVRVAERADFTDAVRRALAENPVRVSAVGAEVSWDARARHFGSVLARSRRPRPAGAGTTADRAPRAARGGGRAANDPPADARQPR